MTNFLRIQLALAFAIASVSLGGCADSVVASGDAAYVRTSVPFKAEFFTGGGLDPEDTSCGGPPVLKNVQDGSGEATHLGRFDVHITFCMDVTDFADGKIEGEESLPYDRGVGVFIAANGDELYFTISGEVVATEKPGYQLEFADAWIVTGGTGRFEGATGSGVTESYVNTAARQTDHVWTAELKLPRGR